MDIIKYIKQNWESVVRETPVSEGELIGVPYPYTVPAAGYFEALYYWDTYFTNVGLFLSDRPMLAKNNTDNILYLVNKFGFMPNSNGTYHLDHSQPPFLSMMVYDVYDRYKDKVWLIGAYEMLAREYDFWMTKRATPVGLNRYDTNFTDEEEWALRAEEAEQRVNMSIPGSKSDIGRHHLGTCESGYDCSSRFGFEIYNYAPVCLNSLLYRHEMNMAFFANELGKEEAELRKWTERAENRKALMNKYMLDEKGLFRDYNFVSNSLSTDFSAASVYPMYCGLATAEQARSFADNLYRLEVGYGIVANEKNEIPGRYQWGYPNGWACHQLIFIEAFDKYGYKDDAKRLAEKYTELIERLFGETQNLWEKYNIVEGNITVSEEYKSHMPKMMGWTAGAYLYAKKYCADK